MEPIPNQSTINAALRTVLLSMLPSGIECIQGQTNRVPEPRAKDFVIFWPTARRRISTNVHESEDAAFVGSIASNILTVTSVTLGTIEVGAPVYGPTVVAGTTVGAFLTGTGGIGTYTVTPAQTVLSGPLAAGQSRVTQATEITVQCDVHGPASAENAQTISTLFRDEYAIDAFAAIDENIAPLLADDPRQIPFLNAEQAYETRWIVECFLQANQSVLIPSQFAATLALNLVSVEAMFPAT